MQNISFEYFLTLSTNWFSFSVIMRSVKYSEEFPSPKKINNKMKIPFCYGIIYIKRQAGEGYV
jgi:hypothetical protein